jgi:hypothetical protein
MHPVAMIRRIEMGFMEDPSGLWPSLFNIERGMSLGEPFLLCD